MAILPSEVPADEEGWSGQGEMSLPLERYVLSSGICAANRSSVLEGMPSRAAMSGNVKRQKLVS